MSGVSVTGAVTLEHDGTALAQYLRVTWDGSALAAAGATDREAGTLEDPVLANDAFAAVLPMGVGSVRKFVASEAIAKGALVYPAAAGKITDTLAGGTEPLGWAKEAASGDGSEIDVLMHPSRTMS